MIINAIELAKTLALDATYDDMLYNNDGDTPYTYPHDLHINDDVNDAFIPEAQEVYDNNYKYYYQTICDHQINETL